MEVITQALSTTLDAMGFALVIDRYETVAGQDAIVQEGVPNTYDMNNGIIVVYDENGYPNVIRREIFNSFRFNLLALVKKFDLRRGAYVPFSNDGGNNWVYCEKKIWYTKPDLIDTDLFL